MEKISYYGNNIQLTIMHNGFKENLHEILQLRAFFPNALSEFMFFVPVLYDSEYDSKTNDTKTSVISVHYDRAERIYL